ncbi:hypothetical protein ACKWRH_45585 (plasmid) [Bradyrhizobium sp. Pa8]|uniref:hypothetical protein n=1 Tax=Bradyrhizobium sp. Pa8 TaxID=3386552 RepID=UPI00403EF980
MSFPREIDNLESAEHPDCTGHVEQEAITNAVRIHNDVVCEYLDLEAKIPSLGASFGISSTTWDDDAVTTTGARQQKGYAATNNFWHRSIARRVSGRLKSARTDGRTPTMIEQGRYCQIIGCETALRRVF